MLFTLQKMIWFLLMPPAGLILLMLFGLVLSRKRRRTGTAFILTGLALLYLLSITPVSDQLLKPLESAAHPLQKLPAAADAVVVPGGGSVDLAWLNSSPVPNGETMSRLVKGVELARRMDIPLVLTGGNGEPFATDLNDADVMAETAGLLGMPRSRMIVENRSRNTLENSHAVRAIVKGDRIILATSAYYTKRAVAMFTRRGFTVIPAPTGQMVQTRKSGPAAFIPRAGVFANSTVALAEWLSLAWWRVRGEL